MFGRRSAGILLLIGVGSWVVVPLQYAQSSSSSGVMSQRRSRPRHVNRQGEMPEPSPEVPLSGDAKEPWIRIALAVDLLQATVTSTAPLVTVVHEGGPDVILPDTMVNVSLEKADNDSSPTYAIQLVATGDRTATSSLVRKVRAQLNAPATASYTPRTRRIVLHVGRFTSREKAQVLARRARTLGYPTARIITLDSPLSSMSRLVLRSPSGADVLRARDRITLLPSDPEAALSFNRRTYRGRILLVRNPRNRLTVINELPLEQYLLGVVPNELNPTAFAEIEALKAQAVAARTYAVRNLGKYAAEGFDLYDDIRSQVYGGKSSEHPLSSRAVEQTRGVVATYDHRPIDAVYTSTCGGRTENSEAIFGRPQPYLRSTVCAPEKGWLSRREIVTQRATGFPHRLALLSVAGIPLPARLSPSVLAEKPSPEELLRWVGALARALGFLETASVTRPVSRRARTFDRAAFAELLVETFYPEGYADLFFTPDDVEYLLDYADAQEIPPSSRASFAVLLRDGILAPGSDGRLRPRDPLTRDDALTLLGRLLDRFDSSLVQTGTLMEAGTTTVTIKTAAAQTVSVVVAPDVFLYKQIAGHVVATSAIRVIGGERLRFHLDRQGRIDYLEVEPPRAGVASDRYSPYAHWEVNVRRQDLSARLRDQGVKVGPVSDLKIRRRGMSGRVIELEIIGRYGRQRIHGQAIRTLLQLRDTLFVIERRRDSSGTIQSFVFIGRGWGHGVGLCQMGAYGLALSGFGYDKILHTYYRGISLEKLY